MRTERPEHGCLPMWRPCGRLEMKDGMVMSSNWDLEDEDG